MTPIWLLVSFGIEFALLAFSASVAVFVVVQRAKRRPLFSSAFFAIYLLESVIGCAHYVVYTVEIQFRGENLFPSGWLNPSESYWLLLITGYCTFFPLISHTAIALNRYTAIVWPTRHTKLWRGKRFAVVLCMLVLLPVIGAVITAGIKRSDTFSRWQIINPTTAGIASVAIILGTCTLSAVVDFWTFWCYRRLSALQKDEFRDDYRLLIFAIFGLVVHLLAVAMTAGMFFFAARFPQLGVWLRVFSQYYVDILCFYGPICLFISSGPVRSGYFAFYGLRRRSNSVFMIPPLSYHTSSTFRLQVQSRRASHMIQ